MSSGVGWARPLRVVGQAVGSPSKAHSGWKDAGWELSLRSDLVGEMFPIPLGPDLITRPKETGGNSPRGAKGAG